jgi:hypothetical protein
LSKYDQLKEKAISNFELLLTYWEVEYIKINDAEYDFLNPTRDDTNHGACRFNVVKGAGADFAGRDFKNSDFLRLGPGFTSEDFAGVTKLGGWGFDVIGLCQRLKGQSNYNDAARLLQRILAQIEKSPLYVKPNKDAHVKRKQELQIQKDKKLISANSTWSRAKHYKNTLAEKYLQSRNINLDSETNIKFHPRIYNTELEAFIPCVLFKVQKNYSSELCAIHRIYISKDGTRKANIDNPKMALGNIQGAGIWFGTPCGTLCIVEGPENALSIRCLGYEFVVSSISASNFSNLVLDSAIKEVILFPDPDDAGKNNCLKAVKNYQKQNKEVKIIFPPVKHHNNKLIDWNDYIMGLGE